MTPAFSVIIPVHNKFPHLERSVFSVLNQTYPSLELLLIDDASTDRSSEKLREFNDPRIKLLKRDVPGPGGYAARNLGIKHATHDWVCFLDADDAWEPNVLETLAGVIHNRPEVEILCWGWIKVKGERKTKDLYSKTYRAEKVKSFNLTDFFNGPQPMWTGGVSMKKDLIVRAGGFPESGFRRGGDMDTWIRCVYHSKKNLRITSPMTYYYLDSVNMVTKAIGKDTSYAFSDFIMQLLQNTKDKALAKAIRSYQSKRIYSVLSDRINKGKSIDYSLLFNMKHSFRFYYLFLRLHLKLALVRTKLLREQ